MSRFGKKGVRCDYCGKIANNENGEYTRPDGVSAGYIHQPEWERFPGGRTDASSLQSSNDICEECAAGLCPFCGSNRIVHTHPAVPGPDGWGGRCKACEKMWSLQTSED
jgi:hypothetical protein